MTPAKLAEITRRSKQDATAKLSGWPIFCPYHSEEDAREWVKQVRLAMDDLKDKK